jgi:hypothetical protein
MRRLLALTFAFGIAAGCSLNPQPLPPESDVNNNGGIDSGTVPAADSGTAGTSNPATDAGLAAQDGGGGGGADDSGAKGDASDTNNPGQPGSGDGGHEDGSVDADARSDGGEEGDSSEAADAQERDASPGDAAVDGASRD